MMKLFLVTLATFASFLAFANGHASANGDELKLTADQVYPLQSHSRGDGIAQERFTFVGNTIYIDLGDQLLTFNRSTGAQREYWKGRTWPHGGVSGDGRYLVHTRRVRIKSKNPYDIRYRDEGAVTDLKKNKERLIARNVYQHVAFVPRSSLAFFSGTDTKSHKDLVGLVRLDKNKVIARLPDFDRYMGWKDIKLSDDGARALIQNGKLGTRIIEMPSLQERMIIDIRDLENVELSGDGKTAVALTAAFMSERHHFYRKWSLHVLDADLKLERCLISLEPADRVQEIQIVGDRVVALTHDQTYIHENRPSSGAALSLWRLRDCQRVFRSQLSQVLYRLGRLYPLDDSRLLKLDGREYLKASHIDLTTGVVRSTGAVNGDFYLSMGVDPVRGELWAIGSPYSSNRERTLQLYRVPFSSIH